MAKNLKLNVKNAQLAEALKLGQIKKPSAKKKTETQEPEAAKATDQAAPVQEKKKRAGSTKSKSMVESASSESTTEMKPPREIAPKETPAAVTSPPSMPAAKESTAPSPTEMSVHAKSSQETPPQTPARDTVAETEQRWRQDTTRAASPPKPSTPPPSPRTSYQENSSYPQRSYPPRAPQSSSGYPPRSSGPGNYSSQQPSSSNYSTRSPSSGGYPPRSPSSGGYPPRSSGPGNYSSQQPSSGGYPPRRPPYNTSGTQSGAPRQGGYPPRSNYPGGDQRPPYRPAGATGGYPPRRPGEYTQGGMRPPGAAGPYRPRPPYPSSGGPGVAPRPGGYAGGGFRPAGPGGYGARPPFTPRGPMPAEETKGGERKRTFETEPRKAPVKDFREHKPSAGKKMEERSFDARDRYGLRNTEDEGWRKRRPSHKMRSTTQQEELRPKSLHVRIPITIKDLAVEMKLKASQLIAKLFMKGVIVTINDFLDDETTIQLLGHDFDCAITIDRSEEERLQITDKTIKQEISETPIESLVLRSPVVAFMGHVDHGKTSLIDAIRTSDVAGDEAGAITQHIGAFTCHTPSGNITILDTPGHEAFSAMRARGADVTDIVVLVIAGDEGMRTQTLEALEQARAANVPIVVAINKCDKPNFDPETVYRQLADQNLLPEAWGGQTITINCSALTKQGIPELLEMLALQAEVLELRANPESRARGTVIESEMHKGLGTVATVLVQNGTLRLGDSMVFGHEFAKVKTMHDDHDRPLEKAGPSTPVTITGLSGLPAAGSEFIVVKNEKEAMEITEKRSEGHRHTLLHQAKRGIESVLAAKAANVKKKVLNLIVRADVQGSVEAMKTSLLKIVSEKIELNILSAAVGEISESDVQLASTSKAVILGFHTKVASHAESLIRSLHVSVRLHDIIYHAVDDIRALMLSMLDKVAQENAIGSAEVKAVFKASQLGLIAGCMVIDGIIKRSSHVKQIRDKQVIWKGPIQSLKKVKEDVREVSKGHECGIVLSGQGDVRVGDIFEAFEVTYLQQEL